jgi:hypothetical protein
MGGVNVSGQERFHNSRALSDVLQGGFFLVKKPLGGCGSGDCHCGTAVAGRSFFIRFRTEGSGPAQWPHHFRLRNLSGRICGAEG